VADSNRSVVDAVGNNDWEYLCVLLFNVG